MLRVNNWTLNTVKRKHPRGTDRYSPGSIVMTLTSNLAISCRSPSEKAIQAFFDME